MVQLQLPAAITLAACGAISLALVVTHRPADEGDVKLPTFHREDESQPLLDPFDVTTAEDVDDGRPIDGPEFWAKVRLRKMAITTILGILLILQSVALGLSITGELESMPVNALLHVFALCTFVFSVWSIRRENKAHALAINYLCSLTFLATLILGIAAILPDKPYPVFGMFSKHASVNLADAFWYTTLALYFSALVLAATTRRGPKLHYPSERIYSDKILMAVSSRYKDYVDDSINDSLYDYFTFSFSTKVVMLAHTASSFEIGDLPIVPGVLRSTYVYSSMRYALRRWKVRIGSRRPKPSSGWNVAYALLRLNGWWIFVVVTLSAMSGIFFYIPHWFLRCVVNYIESDSERKDRSWGLFYAFALFFSHNFAVVFSEQAFSTASTYLQVCIRMQLNSNLFAKTLVRKDAVSSAGPSAEDKKDTTEDADKDKKKNGDEAEFASKAQVMNLMTTDVDRVSDFAWHLFAISISPIELTAGTTILYTLMGVSCFYGLAVLALFLPLNHISGKVVVKTQDNLMKSRDERVSLMNEILGGIRMLKFMAWERNFETRVWKVRDKELKYQWLTYLIEVSFIAIWNSSSVLVALVSFGHFTLIRQQALTPSIAFTAIAVFNEMRFVMNALPETFIKLLQLFVSLKRIEKYLDGAEVAAVVPLADQPTRIAFQSATITWPQDRARTRSIAPSAASTPRMKFVLMDLSIEFPRGELSLICGKLGSGKTLLLLALLGEADLLTGQLICPRSPPNILASLSGVHVPEDKWLVEGVCAYVPQTAWLRNASIRDNILFDLPYVEERYQRTLEVCALMSDLAILEDGDLSEIGEQGVNLSGGQKARVSLARAVYSRASILFLDDVLSAVDAHTAHHLYHECLKGDLMRGRTTILVSHHVQLCAPGANFIVALDNGRVEFQGGSDAFEASNILKTLVQSKAADAADAKEETKVHPVEETLAEESQGHSAESTSVSTLAPSTTEDSKKEKKAPRKLIEEEKRAVGRIQYNVWMYYFRACGGWPFWSFCSIVIIVSCAGPTVENAWLKVWTNANLEQHEAVNPMFYLSIYAAITGFFLVLFASRFVVIYSGSIHASKVLYIKLLESVLFANIRFHDTVSRGRLLNRFGKDFEGIDSSLPDNFGNTAVYGCNLLFSFVSIAYVGGLPAVGVLVVLLLLYYNVGKYYNTIARDMRRLDSVSRSPLYSIYGETIAGVTVIRAFGASSKFLRDMLRCVDTNSNPYYWMWTVNRWLSIRLCLVSNTLIGAVAFIAVLVPGITASTAGFALALATTVPYTLLFMIQRFVGLEQSMVAVERIKEFSEIKREAPELIEPRPPASWPASGAVKCEDLAIRYSPELPNVLHNISFEVKAGEKVGILGRTGSGKSTLALSFFRFVEPTEGRILVDDVDITSVGLTDLRSKLTIIPQDPTILSGTLRSTLDVFSEYEDVDIYEALRRVHLIPSEDTPEETAETINANVFRDLDSSVSEGGENFSTGEKQLLCMARAILKRTKLLVMDEATASVDYATDELIGKTIRQEFAESTILTIAHRLRTIIDYDKVMILDAGKIMEYDKPSTLLSDPSSRFYGLCKATGKDEFAMLKKLAWANS